MTPVEVREAAALTIKAVGANSFQHFWDDRILPAHSGEALSIERRRLLAAMAQCMQHGGDGIEMAQLVEQAGRFGMAEAKAISTIEEFQSRRVFDMPSDYIRPTVELFALWLREKGIQELLVGLPELTRSQREAMETAPLSIQSGELVEVAEGWPSYQGRPVTTEDLRAWLDQFGTPREQRIVFKLLPHLRFYSAGLVREKLKEAHAIVRRGLTQVIEKGKTKRSDIAVTYLGGTGKSSMKIARHYADEANIYTKNVVTLGELLGRVDEDEEIRTVVILDDFVGSGSTLINQLEEEAERLRALAAGGRHVYLLVLCSTEAGAEVVEFQESPTNNNQ